MNQNSGFRILLIVNSKSGGNLGANFLTLSSTELNFSVHKTIPITVQIINLFSQTAIQSTIARLKDAKDTQTKQRVIVCGGDGTVLSVVRQLSQCGCDMQRIVFGVIPLGTGNDFSRALGWGGSPKDFQIGNTANLKWYINEWADAPVAHFDVWDIELFFDENGVITNLVNKAEESKKCNQMKTSFLNYVGFGIDGRISYQFEMARKKSKVMNFVTYACIGMNGACCGKNRPITDFIEQFSSNQQSTNVLSEQSERPTFERSSSQVNYSLGQTVSQIKFRDSFGGLVCLNSGSYMGGRMKCWETEKIGAEDFKGKFMPQRYDDGQIEFLGYKNELSLGLQIVSRQGNRVAQGRGPFNFRFNTELADNRSGQLFMQIDGQSMRVQGLREVVISKSTEIKTGRINVMKFNKEK